MSKIIIDLNTRILDSDHNVFVARPGKTYRFYPDFSEGKIVFPDLPSLELRDGIPFHDYDDLTERVLRSRAIRSWHRKGMPDDDKPATDLDAYKKKARGRSGGQLEGVVRGYFERAAKGDLVLVPPKSYKEPALIGEFADDRYSVVNEKSRFYPGETVSCRRVRWVGQIEKRKLARPILDALEKPNALFLLENDQRPAIYETAYGNYILEGDDFNARFDISSAVFTVDDEWLIQSFFKFIAVNVKQIENGDKILRFNNAIHKSAGEYNPYLQTDIHSPGTLILSCPKLTPLVASVLLAVAISIGPQAVELARADQIVLKNSKADVNDICTTKVREESLQFLRLYQLDDWPAVCERAREVEKKTGIKSPVRIK